MKQAVTTRQVITLLAVLLLVPLATLHPAEIHIRDFGAAGNGTVDDTVALEKAVAALVAASKPAVLRFEAGRTYRIASGTGYAIWIDGQERIHIEGAGAMLLLGPDRRGVALHGWTAVHFDCPLFVADEKIRPSPTLW
jgi:hypothetical protein